MELARVDALVDGLAEAFEAGLDFYMRWKKRVDNQNHYRRPEKASPAATSKCAVSTSLDMSSHRIRATYQVGFALIGPEFSAGDDECRQCLSAHLAQLRERVEGLRKALESKQRQFINLNDMFLVSEAIRIKGVAALADQYRRLAVGRAVPKELPIPRARPRSLLQPEQQSPPPAPVRVFPARDEFDRQTAVWSTTSDMPVFQSEPPSPPLTPKVPTDDTESCFGPPSEVGHATGRQALRPKNSVFSIFCPEAMALQVDPNRPIPASSKGKCSCGYRWKVPELSEATNYMPLKDGFRVTRRFLAKSHCDQSPDEGVAIGSSTEQPSPGYGCVLCTSTGRTETFETAENLQTHINATHDKWQMLHDKDMISPAVNGLTR
ncbi:hypothetical protein B0T24DRAFT_232256 [Lasiosphaeria ovina]|uniref:Uncharacterized protein n=1 Tax=Lasiosphaeria ovina TaxID=92902 RepID=A0AAE0KI14_9PEZI|nr:hypothetical protein B0T24DRAFT_232256 [Lasiosphaeria ovina]